MRDRGGPYLSFDTPRPNFDLILQSGGDLKEQIFKANISLAQKIGIVCLLEPYFHTLLPSKLTLNYSNHVLSGVKSIWPLQDRSDGLRWQKSDEKTQLQRFNITFWTSGALFLDAIGKNTFIDDSSICLGYKLKVSSLFSLCKEGLNDPEWTQGLQT